VIDQNGLHPSSSEESRQEQRKTPRVLGTLESQLMEVLWNTTSELNVQQVCDALSPGHNYKTVMTVLNRLVEKDLLERKLDGRAYRYHPQQTRTSFLKAAADDMVEGYLQAYGQDAAAHLSTAVDSVAPSAVRRSAPESPMPPTTASASVRQIPLDPSPTDRPQSNVSFGKIVLAIAALEGIVLLFGRPRRKG
jgi:predicted transcriptional regulator